MKARWKGVIDKIADSDRLSILLLFRGLFWGKYAKEDRAALFGFYKEQFFESRRKRGTP